MINEVKKFDSNTLLLATDNGLIIYKIKEKEFQLTDIRTSTQPSNVVQSVYQDHYKELWIFPQTTGVIRYNPSTKEMQHLFTPADEVIRYERKNKNVIFEDRQHTLWVLPPEGNLSYYDRENKELKPMLKDSNNPKSVFSPLVRFYTLDNQGNCWLTSTRGIYKLSFFPHTYNLVHIDNGFETRAFLCDNEKRLWVSSKAQMIRVYQPDGQLEGYLTPQGKISKDKQSFTSVYCFLEDHEGNIWIGTKENGIYLLKKKSPDSYSVQQFTHQPNMPYSLSGNSVYSIFQDSHKRIWIGCYGGGINLLTYNKDGKTEFIHSDNELKNYPTGYASKVRHISEAPGGVLLIGTTNGLLTFSNQFERPEEIKFYRNCCESGISTSLSGNDVMHTYTDKQKRTYIASFTGGISQIVSKNLLSNKIEFKTYTTDDGLASDLVQAMQEDQQGNLWILSENAISKFDAQRKTFENYGLNSLHQEFSFSEAAPVINARNQIVFGTDKG
ncbi:MAG: hybrid sensor histidine kinase/response regulator, partial [Bacteroides thetaiotaomicron]|nr:hybrid sensor histidine kinase/response regulator [Bacteroides thetaiotaomicron]